MSDPAITVMLNYQAMIPKSCESTVIFPEDEEKGEREKLYGFKTLSCGP